MGHLIAAAGAVEGVVCALAIARGEMPISAEKRSVWRRITLEASAWRFNT